MHTAPRLTAKEWQNLRRRRLVGPKLTGIEVPCTECGAFFVRQRGTGVLCRRCGQLANTRVQNARRAARAKAKETNAEVEYWLEVELCEYQALDRFQAASYEHHLREIVAAQREAEREQASQVEIDHLTETSSGDRRRDRENAMLGAAFGGPDCYVVEKPLNHALTPDGPDEGYSTYFLPKTEDGYLEADVDWERRTEEAARWWRANPHAFADL